MRKLLHDFNSSSNNETWYDLREDWALIEASIAKQYGIRIRQCKEMPWNEFCNLVAGLMSDTPLGQIVSVRAEKDPKVIKSFSSDQRRIHTEWRKRSAEKQLEYPEKLNKDMENLGKMFAAMFGGNKQKEV